MEQFNYISEGTAVKIKLNERTGKIVSPPIRIKRGESENIVYAVELEQGVYYGAGEYLSILLVSSDGLELV